MVSNLTTKPQIYRIYKEWTIAKGKSHKNVEVNEKTFIGIDYKTVKMNKKLGKVMKSMAS
jgi:hypothetical protein